MLLAAMLAMMLVAAAPAFAQSTAVQFDSSEELTVNTIGNQFTFVGVSQVQSGDANASAVDGSMAEASATNTADIWISQSLSFGGYYLYYY